MSAISSKNITGLAAAIARSRSAAPLDARPENSTLPTLADFPAEIAAELKGQPKPFVQFMLRHLASYSADHAWRTAQLLKLDVEDLVETFGNQTGPRELWSRVTAAVEQIVKTIEPERTENLRKLLQDLPNAIGNPPANYDMVDEYQALNTRFEKYYSQFATPDRLGNLDESPKLTGVEANIYFHFRELLKQQDREAIAHVVSAREIVDAVRVTLKGHPAIEAALVAVAKEEGQDLKTFRKLFYATPTDQPMQVTWQKMVVVNLMQITEGSLGRFTHRHTMQALVQRLPITNELKSLLSDAILTKGKSRNFQPFEPEFSRALQKATILELNAQLKKLGGHRGAES